MNQSKVFALASREEHWGLVVHEAALCGCALLLGTHQSRWLLSRRQQCPDEMGANIITFCET